LGAAAVAALLPAMAGASEAPLRVLATVGMIGDVAAEVAGPCARVETLLGPGVDPHYYAATPSDVDRLSEAELILYVDPALEEQLARVLARFGDRTPAIGVLTAALGPDALLDDPAGSGAPDPHAWMDVSRWARIAPVIAEAVAGQRPDCAADLAGRAEAYGAELAALHGWAVAALASIPEERRMLVTAHDAFGYFADAYGITASEAIEGLSTASEASIADIRAVADFVIEAGVPAVFVETTISPRTIEALVQEVRARGATLEIGGALYSDAMGDAGTPEGTYIGMIRANVRAVVTALGGTLPAWPEALSGWAAHWQVEG
jgi:manganese/zinc/iron transport system substrate-binding protein